MTNGYGHVWTEDRVRFELLKSIEQLMLNRMPTASELKGIGRNDLHVKISRTKKYSGWADDIGLPLKSCDTRKGQQYEKKLMNYLISKGYEVEETSTKHPYDILVNKAIKIDVKVSKIYHGKSYIFTTAKKQQTCDIYVLYGLDHNNEIADIFIIPAHKLRQKTVNVSKGISVWEQYKNKWDYIEVFDKFYEGLEII